jgi:hypothetical protein
MRTNIDHLNNLCTKSNQEIAMGSIFSSAPSAPPPPPPPPPLPDPEVERREARIKAMLRRRRGRQGLLATGERGVLTASVLPDQTQTKLGA